ncbi:hypothetical protein K443DRAFT_684388 [Laccaria amethystina LaAM-08-1]|uniref:Uncharacterized protein n=1 Tax=Laccaria amethystina LaAM-08-1 TaxID=1095629 RepID=A0A0C9XBM6_9AGAR|nr:hypothetical protein K443DRAFT_684388 [Laccaria amethystina LaAM-08-1]
MEFRSVPRTLHLLACEELTAQARRAGDFLVVQTESGSGACTATGCNIGEIEAGLPVANVFTSPPLLNKNPRSFPLRARTCHAQW